MDDDFKDQPLTDIWDVYTESLDQAIENGLLQDIDLGDDYVWPPELNLSSWEQEDVKKYVSERMSEIADRQRAAKSLEPNLIAGYIFRSVIAGLLWEKARVG